MKSHSSFNKQPSDTLKNTLLCLDVKEITSVLTCNTMFVKQSQDEKLWKKLAQRDLSIDPKKTDKDSFYQLYQRAHQLFVKAKKEKNEIKFHNLFMKLVSNGFEKYVHQLIDRVNLNTHFHTIMLDDYPGRDFCYGFLHMAAWVGSQELLTLFIDKGINVNISFQHSAQTSIRTKHPSVGPTPLMLAAARGHTNAVELLIGKDAFVNFSSRHPVLLHVAGGRLLPGSVPYIEHAEKYTALDLAIMNRHVACEALLRSHNALSTAVNSPSSCCVVL